MDFFDKIGQKATETYRYTADKTSKFAKEAKLRISMNENKAKIEELYEEIGKRIYKHHVNQYDVDMDIGAIVEEFCIQIDEICDYIEDERKELLTLKNKRQCINCFYEMESDYYFCPNCGDKQKDLDKHDKQEEKMEDVLSEQIMKDSQTQEEQKNNEVEDTQIEQIEEDD